MNKKPTVNDEIPFLSVPPTLYTIEAGARPLAVVSGVYNDPELVRFDYKDIEWALGEYLGDRLGALVETHTEPHEWGTHRFRSLHVRDADEAEAAVWQRALTAIKREGYLTDGALVCPRCGRDYLFPYIMGTLYLRDPVACTASTRYGRLANQTVARIVSGGLAVWLICTCNNCDRGPLYDGNIALEIVFDERDGRSRLYWDYPQRVVYDTDSKQYTLAGRAKA